MIHATRALLLATVVGFAAAPALAEEIEVPMHLVDKDGVGKEIGTVTLSDSDNGLLIRFNLESRLSPGPHGLPIHETGSCETAEKDGQVVPAGAAGGHWDPDHSGKHLGPSGEGHLGDLPVLYVGIDEDGALPVTHTLVAPRIRDVSRLHGLALRIHQNGDNFRDEPKPLGGGGARVACGVIP